MKFKFSVNSKFWKYLIIFSLPVQILVVQLISARPLLVERVYTDNLYKTLSLSLRTFFGKTPVPVGQILFYSIIGFLLFRIVRQFRELLIKKVTLKLFLKNLLLGTLLFLAVFHFLFMVMWGFNYHRVPISQIVQIEQKEFTTTELENLCRYLIRLTNESRNRITADENQPLQLPLTHDEILEKASLGYQKVANQFPALTYTRPAVKSVYLPELMSFFGVGGIYFPFTGEANVNMDPPAYLLPATVCHEMAHQIGVASEDEANYVAYLACRLSPDLSFQYSGNLMAMRYAMNRLLYLKPGAYQQLEQEFSHGLKLDLEKSKKYWESFDNPISVFSDVFYDLFLKANDQTEGIESYSKMVELIMGEYKKNGL